MIRSAGLDKQGRCRYLAHGAGRQVGGMFADWPLSCTSICGASLGYPSDVHVNAREYVRALEYNRLVGRVQRMLLARKRCTAASAACLMSAVVAMSAALSATMATTRWQHEPLVSPSTHTLTCCQACMFLCLTGEGLSRSHEGGFPHSCG